jgi:DNA-binding SARP family transcriptional activator/pimeloyl-ACP methyl ester carboxylesterase
VKKLALKLFGQPRLSSKDEIIELGLRKAIALLVYLTINKGDFGRDFLATLLWPESDQKNARASLRRTLYKINHTIGEDLLLSSGDSVTLNPVVEITTDVATFRQSIDVTIEKPRLSPTLDADALEVLENSLEVYTEDFLAGFSLPDCHAFEEWRFFECEQLRALLIHTLEALIQAHQNSGRYELAIQHGRRLLSLDPLNEHAHRILMTLYAQANQQSAALRQYHECERILQEELGVTPQLETVRLYENVRQHREIEPVPPLPTHPQVRFVSSGEVHIAYQVLGDGPIDLIFICGLVSHLDQIWEEPNVSQFFHDLADFSRLILFDKRGVGLSDRVGYPPTLEDTVEDILAIMDDIGSERAVLFGMTEGGPTGILFADKYPERVAGLILFGASAKWSQVDDFPWMITWDQYDIWLDRLIRHWGEPFNIERFAPSRAEDPRLREWWARILRMSTSPGGMRVILEVMREIDVRDVLERIKAPTLVLHRFGDQAIRVEAGRHLAQHIPGARYIELAGDAHWPFVGDSAALLKEIECFIQAIDEPLASARILTTILIASTIADSQKAEQPSEAAFIKQEINRCGGTLLAEDKTRFIASFESPSRALHCARELTRTGQLMDFPLRLGLHSGEYEGNLGVIEGFVTKVTEALLETASLYEIIVSRTVKDLVMGSGFTFTKSKTCEVEAINGKWETFSLEV